MILEEHPSRVEQLVCGEVAQKAEFAQRVLFVNNYDTVLSVLKKGSGDLLVDAINSKLASEAYLANESDWSTLHSYLFRTLHDTYPYGLLAKEIEGMLDLLRKKSEQSMQYKKLEVLFLILKYDFNFDTDSLEEFVLEKDVLKFINNMRKVEDINSACSSSDYVFPEKTQMTRVEQLSTILSCEGE